MKRRELLIAGAAAVARIPGDRSMRVGRNNPIPLIHITDLYHPPQDPDDHIDLATAAALPEFDLKCVVLDCSRRFLDAAPGGFDIRRDPGFLPVAQLGYLLGRCIPAAIGPMQPLRHSEDNAQDRPAIEQAGIRLMLDVLEDCSEKAVISVVGSARVLTAAFNRDPHLLKSRVRSVLLNAGSTGGPKREWNVGLDPEAYKGLWKSGMPIHWYPCSTENGAFNPDHERGTYWKAAHDAIFRDVSPALRAWLVFALTGDVRTDWIGCLSEDVDKDTWSRILAQQRNMWATASLVMAAGRVLAETQHGWRFVPSSEITRADRIWPWRLDPIQAAVTTEAGVEWRLGRGKTHALLFGRERRAGFGQAMAEALCALLATLR